jgi:hypothetical protein
VLHKTDKQKEEKGMGKRRKEPYRKKESERKEEWK